MKRQIAAILTATALPLVACTSQTPADQSLTVETVTTSTSSTSTSETPSLSSMTSASSLMTPTSTMTTEPSSTSVAGDSYDAIPVEIPAVVTGVELDAAHEAIEVWRNAIRLYDESMQNPSAEWEAKIRQYVADPAAFTQLHLLGELARDGAHQIGEIRYEAEVVAATAHNVQIRACVNADGSEVVNGDGVSISNPSAMGGFHRDFNVDFYPDVGRIWLLNLITTPEPVESC